MKAKDIVATLQAAEDKLGAVSQLLVQMLGDASQTAKRYKKPASQVAVFRQDYQTWRAACATLTSQDAEAYPEVLADLYPSLLCDVSVGLFALCLEHKAFLGFEVSPEQAQAVLGYKQALHLQVAMRRQEEAQRFLDGFRQKALRRR